MAYLFVANWKMNMHVTKAMQFCNENFDELNALAIQNTEIVLCPSFPALSLITEKLKSAKVHVGAQNCSQHEKGAYTGEVSAQSLAEIGCTFCIVGHSERRQYFAETNEMVAQKMAQLLKHNIQPILCVGETRQEFEKKQVFDVLTKQLEISIRTLRQAQGERGEKQLQGECVKENLNDLNKQKNLELDFQKQEYKSVRPACPPKLLRRRAFVEGYERKDIIAYEPIWSIGTGIIPEQNYLADIFNWLADHLKNQLPNIQVQLIYGGSVNPENVVKLKQISHIDGFLIGGASTDFQTFKKIVLLD